ncbi:hypothetical protein T11_16027, partial [Trichinella zimbabwensis]
FLKVPLKTKGRLSSSNIIKVKPNATSYTAFRVHCIRSASDLFLPLTVMKIVLDNTNRKGQVILGNRWIRSILMHMSACKHWQEYTYHQEKQRLAKTGRAIFPAIMSLDRYHSILRVNHFDDREARQMGHLNDKF